MSHDELRALTAHADPQVARLADEALHAQHRLAVRLASLAGAPDHVIDGGKLAVRHGGDPRDGGLVRVLGPAPRKAG